MTSQPRIFQINSSKGGVPKNPVRTARILTLGVEGDVQRDRRHHGGPDRAICLYSIEQILALQDEGHLIYPGSTGENITTVGLDLSIALPGYSLRLGNHVELEVVSYAAPCRNIIESFLAGEFERMSQKTHPGWSRLYARVLAEGDIQIGDTVTIL